jgi:hypothetical protein
MIIPCNLALHQCLPCNDDPIRNITAEAPDVNVFIGFRDFKWNPPLGVTYFQLACKAICFSEVSQEEANLCALQDAEDCVWDGGEPPLVPPVPPGPNGPGGRGPNLPPQNPRNPIRRYRNTVQTCDAICPDGSPFTESVPAGIVTELSQALADAKAKSLACKLAQRNLFCISAAPPPSACVGDTYFFIATTNSGSDLVWSIDGDLPPGLSFDFFDATITGTPTVGGSYTFIIEVTDSLGRSQSKVLTICIMEIVTPATLPDAETGLVYAEPLIQQPATVSSEAWTLVSGSLPPGILLASSGSMTGIPTENGVSEFTLKVEAVCNGSAVTCQKAFTLEVGGCNCGVGDGTCGIDFTPFSWSGFFPFANGPGSSATGSALENTLTCDLLAASDPFTGVAEIQVQDFPDYPFIIADTTNCSFKLKINVTDLFASGFSAANIGIKIFQDGVLVFHVRKCIGTACGFSDVGVLNMGCNEYDIPLIAAINSKIEIGGDASGTSFKYARCESTGIPDGGSAGLSMTLKLCNI